ncbi:MAG: 1-(5-phosphoribosyl)-5-((5-phosphoribosylamino)methylideneamino)imidazole-4-carboxamide isomerase [Fervidobacterium sp.]|uniref:1-(5-phosphoribosyl)-5-((5- phosphoribosylamino)methylideneamino)imidazole-4- carboxamide isomerase n=1 Tax=Fervidobacterium sp. TaxID=1871331 RepID=UPI00404A9CBB
MLVIPAIDLYKVNVVRMVKGRKQDVIVYNREPVRLVTSLIDDGFSLVHLVDLSRAIDDTDENMQIIVSLSKYAQFIQIGGGIRSLDYSKWLSDIGFKRQIFSSRVLEEPSFLEKVISLGVEPVFSLDTASGRVLYRGWLKQSDVDLNELLEKLRMYGVREIIHTDVEKDGTLGEHDFEITKLVLESGFHVIAAGGISSEKTLAIAQRLYIETNGMFKGVIVGRAFMEGVLDVEVMKRYAC